MFIQLRQKYSKNHFVYIHSLILNWNRGDGPRDGFYTEDAENGVYFLRINNLKENSIDLADVKYINRHVHDKTLKRSQVTAGDLIFAISGTKDNLGTVAIIPNEIKEANLNSALVVIYLDEEKINKQYFCLLFDMPFVRTQIDYIGKGAAQNNLNNQEIGQIQIPLFSLEKQAEIVSLMQTAYASKRQKEAEATALLGSIDAYLMEALGIKVAQGSAGFQNPPNLNKSYFLASAQELRGNRWDSFYYKAEFKENIKRVYTSKYPVFPLQEIVSGGLIKGKLPKDSEKEGECKVVQINAIKEDGKIEIGDLLTAQPIFEEKHILQTGDILVVITGATIGKMALWQATEDTYYLGGDIVKFQCKTDIMPEYIYSFLRTACIQLEIKRHVTGATNGHLAPSDIADLPIPLPPLEIQTQIAAHISDLRTQAKTLQAEAAAEIAVAKAKVEEMLLG